MGNVRTLSGAKAPMTISVTSGKGGVGKTLTSVNLAVAARRMGKSVLILDGDLGLANVDVVLGLKARYNISDVIGGVASLQDIIVAGPLGIDLIPSGSGVSSLTQLSSLQKQQILDQIGTIDRAYDLVIIDTGAGISDTVLHFNMAADQIVVVTTPEPHAMTDAYALIKVLAKEHGARSFDLLVNQTRSPEEGVKIAERIAEVAKRYLDARVRHLVNVPFDPSVPKSVMQRRAASEASTHTIAGQAWAEAARRLLGDAERKRASTDGGFWLSLLEQGSGSPTARVGF